MKIEFPALTALVTLLKGKKTYTIAFLTILYAGLSVYFHQMTVQQALAYVLGGSGLATLRAAIGKLNQVVGE